MLRSAPMVMALSAFVISLNVPMPLQAASLSSTVRGRILLDVEGRGEAWYMSPETGRRSYLGRPDDALRTMREFGLGISEADLARVPTDKEAKSGDLTLRRRLAGQILLQVERRGEAWYVHPVDLKRYYLGRPEDALRVMTKLSLGISSKNLALLPIEPLHPPETLHAVPFLAQAPTGEWNDLRQQEGCEEASALMAAAWARGTNLTAEAGRQAIMAISDQEQTRFGYFHDTSVQDTADRILRDQLDFHNHETRFGITVEDIREELRQGRVLLVTVDGQALRNPNFTPPGPLRHMIVVIGYDAVTDEFITHDPGTSRGGHYRYSASILRAALRDYPSGAYAPLDTRPTAMIIIKP